MLLLTSCKQDKPAATSQSINKKATTITVSETPVFKYDSLYIANSFDYPVGKPSAKGYYNAQKFQENNHLGDDWNAVTGGNSDLGDPIYSIANGYVKSTQDHGGGWGKVVRIIHQMPNGNFMESLYAHCESILVQEGKYVGKGDQIATMGNADAAYLAHLHLEIRDSINRQLGAGYSTDTDGYVDPTAFIS
ncbi:M23 family metallopeptidase [Nonlabens ponticola]|uniref:M23 family metallopeptidase n=1 Tax=Nonlabens ponticola TaxID=2496866 RepID=A0A3S9MZB1_9FLAO|nr:M23 family metallopeptidase [Nonlabens ponticola]AZQ44432.1 M23 family metallopeptidase [Nonlabens ponticola]